MWELGAPTKHNFFIMKTAKKVEKLMVSYGFHLHRSTKHNVWKDAMNRVVVTSKTSSEQEKRLLQNIERDIKKVVAN